MERESGYHVQTVILQHVHLITGAKNIRALIDTKPELWNIGVFNKLVNNFYTTATGYLGRALGNQNAEQHHHTFLNLFLHGKLREAVKFLCKRETELFFKPRNW